MTTIIPDENFIKKNYETTLGLIKDKKVLTLIHDFDERYALCPASSRKNYYSAFPGGLAYHNLHVKFWINKFTDVMTPGKFDSQTLNHLALLHSIGKLGTKNCEYYLPIDSDWHREKGIYYETNPEIQYMKIPNRSLFLIQQYDISLTQDVYLAILLHDGSVHDALPSKEPKLATILRYAAQWAMRLEKENDICWPNS